MALVSVILPTYNEKENIGDLILAILDIVQPPLEIIVVDDDSPDRTWEIVEELQAKHPEVRLIRRIGEKGLATAIAEGVKNSRGDILVWMDCDFSHPPEFILPLVAALEEYDIAITSRWVGDGGMQAPRMRILGSKIIDNFARLLLGISIKDWTSGFIAIKREPIDKLGINVMGTGYGEYFIALLAKGLKSGYKVKEIPYVYAFRQKGTTKTSPSLSTMFGLGFSYCRCILSLKFRKPK